MHEAVESLVQRIAGMKRPGLIKELRSLDCNFPIDFSDEFLQTVSIERLRHIILAASLHTRTVQTG
ncbi:MAG: hypothetical protein GXY38_07775 [Planctomycetes bacterium]|jgi:hypothetical protein|nr:hypothetical protein [Planctomycetota bacterium]